MKAFAPEVYRDRIRRVVDELRRQRMAGAVIGAGPELAYLTGSWVSSHERLTALCLSAEGAARLVVPATDAGGIDVAGVEIVGWRDGDDAHAMAASALGEGAQRGPVGLGSSLTADHVLRLQELLPETTLAARALAGVFAVKDALEIEQIGAAADAIDAVHARVPGLLRPGRTEEEVALDIERLILSGHDAVDFVIVGSGPNGANPHHSRSGRVLREGDPVVVDIGGSFGAGYHSDCTRTYQVAGPADPEFTQAYAVLQRAQQAAVEAAAPGMTAGALDAVARRIIAEAGYGDYFTHRTGHGLGLSLHEEPFIVAGSDVELREGMVFSIEPGIYLPERWGMRIEDIVVLEGSGARRLNRAPRGLR
ncbi:M24 family metallopeptidase [Corynebacterium timonense]|uniref:Xaa-Pro aminopeptidase n=1 Tax=Corynebacterium timonense TaxID=441500 RepID=A0A1H1PA12_9CORY|nr:Xaa-Pro peptidase family protein [Corynebacterium timonense]SDS07469.1 Xaa-Pro aminopeptidase [Corynebacterium timonense]